MNDEDLATQVKHHTPLTFVKEASLICIQIKTIYSMKIDTISTFFA
jgi:hypothetical protein